LPKDFDPSAKGKYSLLVFVYGAPEYQNVDTLWTTDFVKAYLPSSYNVITALIDGRGSGYEGDKVFIIDYVYQTSEKTSG
jgi:dipeptidyl aminopeptidase/acylaminoacyl peptidase